MREHAQPVKLSWTRHGGARAFRPAPTAQQSSASLLQRKAQCACGGGCPRCGAEEPPLQTKLRVGEPGDAFEREADQVADHVMRMPLSGHAHDAETGEAASTRVSRHASAPATPHAHDAPPSVHSALRSPGSPLDATTREFMESRFGRDFGRVRVHTDREAADSAGSVSARAYTVGNHIVFGRGEYAPASSAGRHLLAHELTHVLQQRGAGAPHVQRTITPGCAETESSAITNAVARAHANLETAVGMLAERPLSPTAKNALWLAFRDDSNATAEVVSGKLSILKDHIQAADYTCVNSAHPQFKKKCESKEQTYGFVGAKEIVEGVAQNFTGAIHLCMPRFADYVISQQVRAVIHEGSHRILGAQDLGYFSTTGDLSAPNCVELPRTPDPETSGTAGLLPGVRLDDADAYACFIHFLINAPRDYVVNTAKQYRGGELNIVTRTSKITGENEIYTVTETPREPSFLISGVPPNGRFQFRWSFVAGGMKFAPLKPTGKTAVTYDEENTEVYIGQGARSTLAGRGGTKGKLICEAQLVGPFDPSGANAVSVDKELTISEGQDPNDPVYKFRQMS